MATMGAARILVKGTSYKLKKIIKFEICLKIRKFLNKFQKIKISRKINE